jgi:hypothetical protein
VLVLIEDELRCAVSDGVLSRDFRGGVLGETSCTGGEPSVVRPDFTDSLGVPD